MNTRLDPDDVLEPPGFLHAREIRCPGALPSGSTQALVPRRIAFERVGEMIDQTPHTLR